MMQISHIGLIWTAYCRMLNVIAISTDDCNNAFHQLQFKHSYILQEFNSLKVPY